jgi:hypothetical protein
VAVGVAVAVGVVVAVAVGVAVAVAVGRGLTGLTEALPTQWCTWKRFASRCPVAAPAGTWVIPTAKATQLTTARRLASMKGPHKK